MSEYYDSAENLMVTKERVCQELKAHGVVNVHEFFEELGFSSHYKAQDVLDWLGY
jgi:hypothetical protein|tara:strand:+ start:346 stop:510 length:165 start_codon:yes stop_codon:yes gene_type:complete